MKIEIDVDVDERTAERMEDSIIVLLNKLDADELELLAKAVQKPGLKAKALGYLRFTL